MHDAVKLVTNLVIMPLA